MACWRSLTRSAVLPSKTRLTHPPAPPLTAFSPMRIRTSTRSWSTWGYAGRATNLSPSGVWCHTLASTGIWTLTSSTSWGRRKPDMWLPSRSGKQSTPTTSSKHKSYMGSFYMLPWSSPPDVLISQAWRPCWALSITVLSYRTPHPETPQTIWNGGSSSSTSQMYQDLSHHPNHSSITKRTRTPAPGLAWPSRSAQDGVHGSSPRQGHPVGRGRQL